MKLLLSVLFAGVVSAAVVATDTNTTQTVPKLQQGYGPETVANWAEYITVNETRHLWYWFFESRSDPVNDPFVLWMTGGPGCSGLVALFYENGPYHIMDDLSLKLNPYSWNTNANVMWVDQPVGTGFSYSDDHLEHVISEKGMADNMHEFLQTFMKNYPKYQKNRFFITGESYAGHYIPALAHRVWQGNNNKEGNHINLQGIAIGNGLVDPKLQYSSYSKFAAAHQLVDNIVLGLMEVALPPCLALIDLCRTNSTLGWLACFNAYDECNFGELVPVQGTGVNVYDVREQCKVAPLCYDFSNLDKFLVKPDVVKALNVKKKWTSCDRVTNLELVLAGDWMLDYSHQLPALLQDHISVLVYSGEFDFVCNWLGGQNWVHNFNWTGQADFNKATNNTWHVDGQVAGSSVSADNLTFVRVKDAGHLVPYNQPKNALVLLSNLFSNSPFN